MDMTRRDADGVRKITVAQYLGDVPPGPQLAWREEAAPTRPWYSLRGHAPFWIVVTTFALVSSTLTYLGLGWYGLLCYATLIVLCCGLVWGVRRLIIWDAKEEDKYR